MVNLLSDKWLFPKGMVEAKNAQQEMAERVLVEDRYEQPLLHIAGADISNIPFDPEQMIFASMVVLSYPSLELVENATASFKQEFPYIPGFLGFREVPALVQAYNQLSIRPDLILVDGHGISHPRGLGVASHLGVLLDTPTIGVAKSILIGKPTEALPQEAGSKVSLQWKGKEIGAVLRSKKRCSPVIISVGHRVTLESAIQIASSCLKKYRLPEPVRQAHLAANACRKKWFESFTLA